MVRITINDNGPYKVEGEGIELVNGQGEAVEHKDAFWLCRCGESANKPFCDGAHKRAGFESIIAVQPPA